MEREGVATPWLRMPRPAVVASLPPQPVLARPAASLPLLLSPAAVLTRGTAEESAAALLGGADWGKCPPGAAPPPCAAVGLHRHPLRSLLPLVQRLDRRCQMQRRFPRQYQSIVLTQGVPPPSRAQCSGSCSPWSCHPQVSRVPSLDFQPGAHWTGGCGSGDRALLQLACHLLRGLLRRGGLPGFVPPLGQLRRGGGSLSRAGSSRRFRSTEGRSRGCGRGCGV